MDKIEKFLRILDKKQRAILAKIFGDIRVLNLSGYDIKALKGMPGLFRLRKGNIRVVYLKKEATGLIVDVAYRKDVYKNL